MARTANKLDIPDRLTRAGRELFWRNGYSATGIQDITALAGVPKGSFYNHFESKEAFAVAIIEHYAAYLQQSWEAMLESAPQQPLAAIRHVFARMMAHHERKSAHTGCLVGNLAAEIALSSEPCRAALHTAQKAWRDRLAGLIRQAQASGDIRGDLAAAELSGLAWDAWEGALLRMKLECSIEPLHRCVELLFDHLFRPAAPAACTSSTAE